jgi:Phospholipase_D-nuclease N-terminal
MVGYVYPLLSIFWTMLMFAGVVLMLFVIVWCFIDNFSRRDHHGWAKAGWTILILLLPVIGALVYVIARPAVVD